MANTSHHEIRESILARIHAGEWKLGELIPGEAKLAEEYNCARTTVNRALRNLADEGLVVRKRKSGTRICQTHVRHAKLKIPIIREQVEATGQSYRHKLIKQRVARPPASIRSHLQLPAKTKALYLETLHLAENYPFAFEIRWLNIDAIPSVLQASLDQVSVNEWLVKSVPFSSGDVAFSAVNAGENIASALGTRVDQALFLIDRTTWLGSQFITTMKLYYKADFQLYSQL